MWVLVYIMLVRERFESQSNYKYNYPHTKYNPMNTAIAYQSTTEEKQNTHSIFVDGNIVLWYNFPINKKPALKRCWRTSDEFSTYNTNARFALT